MLAYIKGTLEMKLTEYVVIDVGGLGYKVFMSGIGIEKLGEIGSQVKVYTYYRVREDDISIFGNDPRGRNICVENSMFPFFLYEYAYNYRNHKFPGLLKLPVKKVVSSSSRYGYRFIDDVGKIEQETVQIQGYIESTFFLMIIDPNTKNFVLNLQIRH